MSPMPVLMYRQDSLVPNSLDSSDSTQDSANDYSSGLSGYGSYLLFLIVPALACAFAVLFILHRRRRQRKNDQQHWYSVNALAREIENGGYRHHGDGEGASALNEGYIYRFGVEGRPVHRRTIAGVTRADEGLDDQGEAPPKYEAAAIVDKPPAAHMQHIADGLEAEGTSQPPLYEASMAHIEVPEGVVLRERYL